MEADIFEQFPDREAFDRYWEENYVPVTYEDVRGSFEDFVTAAGGHIYLSDYEEKGCISREDFMENPPKNLKLLGMIDREKMNEIYNIGEVLFLPSFEELFPMTIL